MGDDFELPNVSNDVTAIYIAGYNNNNDPNYKAMDIPIILYL